MGKKLEVIGKQFGRLKVIREIDGHRFPSGALIRKFKCECSCGKIVDVFLCNLSKGNSKSCGCIQQENRTKHGMCFTRTYKTWATMCCRGRGTNSPEKYYDRGIRVCPRWLKFENFLADMGERPEGMTIERIDNNKGYFPGNCKWATPKEQVNNRRNTVMVTVDGETLPLTEMSEKYKIHPSTAMHRLRSGCDPDLAFKTPPGGFQSHWSNPGAWVLGSARTRPDRP